MSVETKAILFSGVLLICLLVGIIMSFFSSGPIILGSELNGNGTTEYLCLGSGCQDL